MKSIFVITFVIVTASSFLIALTKFKAPIPVQSSTDNSGPRNEDDSWDGAWTNIVPPNRTGQSFIAKSPTVSTVEVALLTTGNNSDKDTIVMKVLSEDERVLAQVSRTINNGFDGWLSFEITERLKVVPGQKLVISLEDSGKALFGWKYRLGKYFDGGAIMLGTEDKRFDFLFRVNP